MNIAAKKSNKVGRPRVKLASRLQKMREEKNISFKEALSKIGISQSLLYSIERGDKRPSPDMASKMCDVYGCTLDEIYGRAAASQLN